MKIAGFQKTSFVDYPKIVSCVVFTPGCNMRCSYCHNKHILSGNIPEVDELAVLDYLRKRVGVISGVVVSGGEPTLQNDLERFVTVVKNMGYKIKLDTNGTNPEVLKSLCEKGLVDYVAMDLKAPIEKYSEICCAEIDVSKVKTYACKNATNNSKNVIKISSPIAGKAAPTPAILLICPMIKIIKSKLSSTICPESILANKRMANTHTRMIKLITSKGNISGTNHHGVPPGTKLLINPHKPCVLIPA